MGACLMSASLKGEDRLRDQGRAVAAGGLFLQVMPDADDATIGRIEEQVVSLPSIGTLLAQEMTPTDLVSRYLEAFSPRFIGQREVAFFCHCSRDQIRNVLTLLPKDELEDIQVNGPFPVEIRCHHCNTRYTFDREHIDRIVATRFSGN
jgi:molecular chaperone Hsp33